MILAVAIDTPLRRVFDYRSPPGVAVADLKPGQRLWVPFGRRRLVAVLVEVREHSDVPANKLRTAEALIDETPLFDPVLFELIRWAAGYYRHPIGEVFAAAMPSALRAGANADAVEIRWRLTRSGREHAAQSLPKRQKRLQAMVAALRAEDPQSESALGTTVSRPREVLRELAERGFVEQIEVRPPPPASSNVARATPVELSAAQQQATDAIRNSLGRFRTLLLHGVTGSGKTEVYLQAIATCLARGEQALVLVPEIALTPQLVQRFSARFEASIATLHSGMNDTERLDAWRRARSGEASIVIGTRSAVFAPLPRPGLIVVDEEHDPSFKQQEGFRYSARDLAIVRAQRHGIPIVLGSATPSLETLSRAQREPESLLLLTQRAGGAAPPALKLVDLRHHGQAQGISTPALQAMREHLDRGGQVMLFINRRGYAPVLFCPNCGWSAHCERCDARLTVHRRTHQLACHHCDARHEPIEHCPQCMQPTKPVGQGTERIEETVQQLFPDAPLARIDRDTMRAKGELEATLDRVNRGEIRILVGTQILTKGHHFPLVTLVVVLNADHGLFSADFRASERLAQTIVQVSGRAGRAQRAGEVLIQTEYPAHPLLGQLLAGGYDAFAAAALKEREQAHWPPFARLALLRAEAAQTTSAMKFLRAAHRVAQELNVRGVRLLGPAPAPMERRVGQYRAQLLLHADTHGPLQRLLEAWLPALEALPESKRVRWSIDVDPLELF
jgi:primosomal protein N' (replication factor Y) (superfamily II helicase)